MHQNRFILTSAAAFCVLALSGSMPLHVSAAATMPSDAPPEEIILTGVVRDFRERTVTEGHPDFESTPEAGYGHFSGNIRTTLGEDGKPVWVGGGYKVATQWKDKNGRPIAANLFEAGRADLAGAKGANSSGGVDGADSFHSWFRDVPGVNASAPVALRLLRSADGSYVFDDKLDEEYASKGGFFPIDDQLFGNSAGTPNHNYHFTFELHTDFVYDEDAQQVFKFIGDDDVYVFINDRLVIDLGGIHTAVEQFVDLNRLGLSDGETYRLDFFFAERHRTQSNFRLQTNILMTSPDTVPTISSSFD